MHLADEEEGQARGDTGLYSAVELQANGRSLHLKLLQTLWLFSSGHLVTITIPVASVLFATSAPVCMPEEGCQSVSPHVCVCVCVCVSVCVCVCLCVCVFVFARHEGGEQAAVGGQVYPEGDERRAGISASRRSSWSRRGHRQGASRVCSHVHSLLMGTSVSITSCHPHGWQDNMPPPMAVRFEADLRRPRTDLQSAQCAWLSCRQPACL